MLKVGTKVEVLRPNMWAELQGSVEAFGGAIHLVRVSYPDKPGTFLVAARYSELREI
jgi:hypothetical protein